MDLIQLFTFQTASVGILLVSHDFFIDVILDEALKQWW